MVCFERQERLRYFQARSGRLRLCSPTFRAWSRFAGCRRGACRTLVAALDRIVRPQLRCLNDWRFVARRRRATVQLARCLAKSVQMVGYGPAITAWCSWIGRVREKDVNTRRSDVERRLRELNDMMSHHHQMHSCEISNLQRKLAAEKSLNSHLEEITQRKLQDRLLRTKDFAHPGAASSGQAARENAPQAHVPKLGTSQAFNTSRSVGQQSTQNILPDLSGFPRSSFKPALHSYDAESSKRSLSPGLRKYNLEHSSTCVMPNTRRYDVEPLNGSASVSKQKGHWVESSSAMPDIAKSIERPPRWQPEQTREFATSIDKDLYAFAPKARSRSSEPSKSISLQRPSSPADSVASSLATSLSSISSSSAAGSAVSRSSDANASETSEKNHGSSSTISSNAPPASQQRREEKTPTADCNFPLARPSTEQSRAHVDLNFSRASFDSGVSFCSSSSVSRMSISLQSTPSSQFRPGHGTSRSSRSFSGSPRSPTSYSSTSSPRLDLDNIQFESRLTAAPGGKSDHGRTGISWGTSRPSAADVCAELFSRVR